MTVIRLGSNGRMLCPNLTTGPQHPAHRNAVRFSDAFYEHVPKDAEGELTGPAAEVYHKALRGDLDDWMDLYVDVVTVYPQIDVPQTTVVHTWHWRCHICGLVLPATAVETR